MPVRIDLDIGLHAQDYFVCDGDVVWDGDYMDFIHINRDGQRVLDHSKVDLLKSFKVQFLTFSL